MIKHLKPESVTFLVTLGVVGVLLTIVGAFFSFQGNIFWMSVFGALGAAIIGAAFSLLIARIFEPSPMGKIFQAITEMKNSPLIADDTKVRSRRIKYHGYILSHALGKSQWKYRVFDFSKDPRPGYLHAKVDVWVPIENPPQPAPTAPANSDEAADAGNRVDHQIYHYDGYLCDTHHLVLVGRLDQELGTEPDVIQIFPFSLKTQDDVIAGLAFLESSDNKQIVTPTLLSKTRRSSETRFGPVKDPQEQARLLKTWQDRFLRNLKINVPPESLTSFDFTAGAPAAPAPSPGEGQA